MTYNKKIIMSATAAGIVGLAGVSTAALAQDSSGGDKHPPIVRKLAETFNLDENKVNEVFVAEKEAHRAEKQARLIERLDQAVQDGKITPEQKTKLLAKLDEMKSEFQNGDRPDKQDRQNRREEFKKWAEDNGIDLKSLGLRHERGFGPHNRPN